MAENQEEQDTLSYNRHNLTADTSERQAKEILIRRRHSLRESIRKDSSLSRERRECTWNMVGIGSRRQNAEHGRHQLWRYGGGGEWGRQTKVGHLSLSSGRASGGY
ncbi:hypothetical protein QTO34_012828 [Cnephaeus nilssonii]|uniref:Sodium/hydrogen exchanger regulatory region domain-containing protein n=1 Tax=Cnephaeus nilssonii TaxID=3371016 RepID=A0AA40HAV6_CNENI|nr:hypothetical protein QTO34_012828 [Eptesicus nilssonii]